MKKHLNKKSIIIGISIIFLFIVIILATIIVKNINNKKSKESKNINENNKNSTAFIEIPLTKQNKNKQINIDEVLNLNEKDLKIERIEKQEIDVEFNTQYRENNSLPKGKMQTIQEGQDGKQNAVVKNVYLNNELISTKQVSSEITKVAIDKVVEVGTGSFYNNYVPIIGDTLKVTAESLAVRVSPDLNAEKVITIKKGEQVILKQNRADWYYIQYNSYFGWVPKDCLIYYNPNSLGDGDENNIQYTKEQLTQGIGFSMLLNKKSGLSLSQYKKIFENDSNDKNNAFKNNAEFFYYAEQQYNLNGLFLAAIAIHESAWGTSSISLSKLNLFGYQAYDRDPSGNAAKFNTYAEGIDLVARVLVKYYLNPAQTPIYGGEKAVGTYYRGATVSAVNKSYASDQNWANGVYKWMLYLYNKL